MNPFSGIHFTETHVIHIFSSCHFANTLKRVSGETFISSSKNIINSHCALFIQTFLVSVIQECSL